MKNTEITSRVIRVVYRFVLPAITLIFLLIVSSSIKRPLAFGSLGGDFFVRGWIILAFCSLYIRLSDLGRYMFKVYRITIDHSNDNDLPLNWRNIFVGILLGVASIPFTWWIVQFFLPLFSGLSWLLAFANGVLISIPMMLWRNELML
jgi:hypothetical protein